MKRILRSILFLLSFICSMGIIAQEFISGADLEWKGIVTETLESNGLREYLYFTGGMTDPNSPLPSYTVDYPIDRFHSSFQCSLENPIYQPFSASEQEFIRRSGFSSTAIQFDCNIFTDRKKPRLGISFIPIRLNPETGLFEKLLSFDLVVRSTEEPSSNKKLTARSYADHSVLASGDWYKLKAGENGVYKISRNDLITYGMDPAAINPKNIRIYGNAGGMLPEKNSEFRYDDLQENAIYVHGEEDGSFDAEDYILFYGSNPITWTPALDNFLSQVHYYDDFNYYFLTAGEEPGQRVEWLPQATGNPTSTVTNFNDYQVIEDETHNLIESGKAWYGDEFGETKQQSYSFHFPRIEAGSETAIKVSVANRTYINDLMLIKVNDQFTDSVTLTSIDVNSTKYAQVKKKTNYFSNLGPEIKVDIEYEPAEPGSRMWLNFINVNTLSGLYLDDGQLLFRNLSSVSEGAVTEFKIQNATNETRVWDVTNPIRPAKSVTTVNGSSVSFIQHTDSLREFIAFDGTSYLKPTFVSVVANQDLHGSGPFDYVIVTHPLFIEQAEQLADLHRTMDGFSVLVVTPEVIYNEFSSGKQDPTAIRDLLKLYYDRDEGQEPRYLLLFGDGSYDPKDRLEHNTNLVPTFQTIESLIAATSYVVDDYFGLLDDDEGNDAYGYLDVGIGRLPVQTAEEAQQVVDKIIRYMAPEEPQFGKWRTKLCIIADDEDGNLHLEQADSLSSTYGYISPLYNQDKIYLDAFPQLKTPTGDKYPEVTEHLNEDVEEGALIINYIGHGGVGGWAHERILQQNDMVNWKNDKKLPLFITATCEFSRFDEPEIVSGGELVLLNPIGGGIALFTTTRLAYSQSNFRLNQRLYARAFTPVNGEMPYLGDLIRESKPPGQQTTRNFVLLGDPAMKLSYPKHQVKTLKINGTSVEKSAQDTLRALQKVTVSGEIQDIAGNQIQGFNGILYPVLYDKHTRYKTLGNDPASFPVDFYNQDKVIWQGKTDVKDGSFEFSFVIPLDIAFNFGNAKFSYYAHSESEDASGYYNDFILGGIDDNAAIDNTGPNISLFINDTTFVSGALTHENPVFIAFLSDENGINLSQNGIGHNITLILDDDYSNVMIMDPYYQYNANDYCCGYMEYPFYDLPNGHHTLTLKAWDSYNNSSVATVEFVIDKDSKLKLYEVTNYPNPFAEQTTFTFHHSRPGNELNVELTVYDLTGRYLISYSTSIYSNSTSIPFLTWDGRDVNGAKLSRGIYPYTVRVTDELGQEVVIRQKLIMGY